MSNFSSGSMFSFSTNGRSSIRACFLISSRSPFAAVSVTSGVSTTGLSLLGGVAVIGDIPKSSLFDIVMLGVTGCGISGFAVLFVSRPKLLIGICVTPARTLANSWSSLIGFVVCGLISIIAHLLCLYFVYKYCIIVVYLIAIKGGVMLDDFTVIKQRDPNGALSIASLQYEQVHFCPEIRSGDHDNRQIKSIVLAGMGGSGLAASLAKIWLNPDLPIPIEIVRGYDLPDYVDKHNLIIISSYSGNTEEELSCICQAIERGAQIGVIASGGELLDLAIKNDIAHVPLPIKLQPRMAVFYGLRALIGLMVHFGVISKHKMVEIYETYEWLHSESLKWSPEVLTKDNYAKRLANLAVGKTAVFYGGALTAPVAYKWKISWNENAKNLAFWNELPEFDHNEFMGWTSHPIEKPFVIFDIISSFENSQILKRFKITDKLLSGKRPKAVEIELKGKTLIEQLLWGSILADFTSIYLAILNNVNPTPVPLIEKLKDELK